MSPTDEITTVADIARFWASCASGDAALIGDTHVVSYGELDCRSSYVANRMREAGVQPGSHVGYLGMNSVGFFDAWFGAGKAGCAFAPFNWRLAPAELAEIIDDAQPSIVFVESGFAEKMQAIQARTSARFEVVLFDGKLNEGGLQVWAAGAGRRIRRSRWMRRVPACSLTPRAPPAGPRAWCFRTTPSVTPS